jgi:hemolysin activation/secretion protein
MNSQLVKPSVVVCMVVGLMAPALDTGGAVAAGERRPMRVAQADSSAAKSLAASTVTEQPTAEPASEGFAIKEFIVEGSELLPSTKIEQVLMKYRGEDKQMADLENARADLEKAYQALGYPTVIVSIPEQTIEAGTVLLRAIEGRLFDIQVTGNNYYPRWQILDKLSSVRVGNVLQEGRLVKELDAVNVNPDLKVTPVLKAGSLPETVDMELKVKDRLPLHAKLTGDNKGPFTTPANRLTAEVSYSNLWEADHILSVQTIQTPTDWGAVQGYSGTYVVPIDGPRHALAVYASKVISNSILGGSTLAIGSGDIAVAGNATVAGMRYFFPILEGGTATHSITLGADYKRLEKTEAIFPGELGTAIVLSPIQYTPLSIGYSMVRQDPLGVTLFSATAKGYWPIIPEGKREDFSGDPNDPNKPGNRAKATGKFAVVQASLDRTQPLPWGFMLALHADAQWASEPLVPAESYFAGGADSVRGYVQSESIGDHAVRGRVELTSPNLIDVPLDWIWQRRKSSNVKIQWKLATFYDAANLWVARAPAGQQNQFRLEGVGGGIRAQLVPYNLALRVDQGWALRDATTTRSGDSFVHFIVSAAY